MYLKGDLLVDFGRRVLFIYPGPENFDARILVQCRLATPGEARIFAREFPKRKELPFADFKSKMETFDGRKRRGIIYGYVPIDESQFMFLRSMKHQFRFHADFSDKLSILIDSYIRVSKHNPADIRDLDKLKTFRALLIELIQDKPAT